jgi:hypothetical protein
MPYVLVVDDDADSRELLAGIVAREGFIVGQADSLKTARVQLSRRTPDLILVDLRLPDGSSISWCGICGAVSNGKDCASVQRYFMGLIVPIDWFSCRGGLTHADLKQEIGELRDELRRADADACGNLGTDAGAGVWIAMSPTSAPVPLIGSAVAVRLSSRAIARTLRRACAVSDAGCSAVPSPLEAELFDGRSGGAGSAMSALERAVGNRWRNWVVARSGSGEAAR